MSACGGTLLLVSFCLAIRLPRPRLPATTGLSAHSILWCLTCLVFALGTLLFAAAVLTWRAPELDEPPKRWQGERCAREGRLLVLAGVLLPLFTSIFLIRGMLPTDGMLVPAIAMQVATLWGGGRVLVAAGGVRRPATQFLLGGITVLFAGCVAATLEYVLWGLARG